MYSYDAVEVLTRDLRAHPAVRAWALLQPQRVLPERIAVLKGHPDQPWKQKSAVYRLEGVGAGGSTVIAKRCVQEVGMVERIIYEEVLPTLPVPSLHCYGSVNEPNSKSFWLFLEDAQGVAYLSKLEEHRSAAADWLALLHTSAEHITQADRLPNQGLPRYLDQVRSSYQALLQGIRNPALMPTDVQVLRALLQDLEELQARWWQLESICSGLPTTLVHGDFVGKNMRVRTGAAGALVIPYDWEMSGWGLPLADLGTSAKPTLSVYWAKVRDRWPSNNWQDLQRFGQVGALFRLIASIDWATPCLGYEWVRRPMLQLVLYQTRLHEILKSVMHSES